jgi:hypothetical protein
MLFRDKFYKILQEEGPNYVPAVPNTAGTGGSVGGTPEMDNWTASGTPGTDSWNKGDFRFAQPLGAKVKGKKRKPKIVVQRRVMTNYL